MENSITDQWRQLEETAAKVKALDEALLTAAQAYAKKRLLPTPITRTGALELVRKVRKEEGDYTYIVEKIKEVPNTWLPGLLIAITQACLEKKVFKSGGLTELIEKVIRKEIEDGKSPQ